MTEIEHDGPGVEAKASGLRQGGSRHAAKGVVGAFPTFRRSRFADQAYAFLFHKIIMGEFREGQMLPPENEMCAMFGISRPVVREALDRLRSEGLIVSRRGLGSFVQARPKGHALAPQKLKLFEENLEFRRIVEPHAVMLACARRTAADLKAIRAAIREYERVALRDGAAAAPLDAKFHLAVASASHNLRVIEAIRSVEYDIGHGVNLMRRMDRFDNAERCRTVLAEHNRIYAAIEAQDRQEGERAMLAHLERAEGRIAAAQND
ncbi:MAG: FadR family transcriptional regulator [Methylobacteriaceae bacterium]|nr:FadR family transcriptional regulator [Methylobacteriaceae bacterium]